MMLLIRKEMFISVRSLAFLLIFVAIFSFFTYSIVHNLVFAGMMGTAIAFINNLSVDKRNEGFRFIYSLPVKRTEIVKAKYVTGLLYTGAGLVIGIVLSAGVKLMGGSYDLQPAGIAWTLALIIVLLSVNIPVYLLLGDKESMVATILMMIVLFGSSGILSQLARDLGRDDGMSLGVISVLSVGGSLLLYGVSYAISAIGFAKKDL
ncbi:ABC-2 transporter permease [Paenibacillus dendritiformis]|uniref:ABC-2 transporter permease n=1 Tax=Paenibacillus dendritiformis TaxID=130049 RepID=UPI00143D3A16|nr:ABC-2 transporter permease [Paenibacillus dendritiformis]NKI21736.1 ABC-2 transporter permease [Paenibacillus dendritiformis]NRG01017.1 ABC-2 transporter permease [Paenibacillus dendritiformis]